MKKSIFNLLLPLLMLCGLATSVQLNAATEKADATQHQIVAPNYDVPALHVFTAIHLPNAGKFEDAETFFDVGSANSNSSVTTNVFTLAACLQPMSATARSWVMATSGFNGMNNADTPGAKIDDSSPGDQNQSGSANMANGNKADYDSGDNDGGNSATVDSGQQCVQNVQNSSGGNWQSWCANANNASNGDSGGLFDSSGMVTSLTFRHQSAGFTMQHLGSNNSAWAKLLRASAS